MTIKEIVEYLDTIAPAALQEKYDNSGLLVGDEQAEISEALICLDVTEDVLEEAIAQSIGLIISHHPLIFGGLKRLVGADHVQRIVSKAIKHDIALYAIHTNLDNVMHGVNGRLAEVLGLKAEKALQPKQGQLMKLAVHVPEDHVDGVREALWLAGAGWIGNYSECSFSYAGSGSFKPEVGAEPASGQIGSRHEEKEMKIEVIVESWKASHVLDAMRSAHPYEEVAYDLISLENSIETVGTGLIGSLTNPLTEIEFLKLIKKRLKCKVLRHSPLTGERIEKVAICGGSGAFLLKDAIRSGVQAFVTADLKYHQFQEPDGRMLLVDAGHYETESATMELIADLLGEKFPKFALRLTKTDTNPIHYA